MSAIRVARAFTGRDLIVKFAGCYHGHADHLLVAAGSGLATFGRPSSAGVPEAFTACTRVLPLDDEAALQELFQREGARIALKQLLRSEEHTSELQSPCKLVCRLL